jgi:ubiquinone/menaquinone biosynthesis C-methylase UbiE
MDTQPTIHSRQLMSESQDRTRALAPLAATRWEQAYQAFETCEEEHRKFVGRLESIGAHRWKRNLRIVEVCSGRGSGLRAWHAIGFEAVLGVDCSHALVSTYRGPGRCVLGDARALPLATASRDVAVVQGGLHHLFTLDDVDQALAEMRRVVTHDGRIVIIEPWLTPFLRFVHMVCERPTARRFSTKIDALATMIEEERETYERWLNAPAEYLNVILRHVAPQLLRRGWGKLIVVGSPRP